MPCMKLTFLRLHCEEAQQSHREVIWKEVESCFASPSCSSHPSPAARHELSDGSGLSPHLILVTGGTQARVTQLSCVSHTFLFSATEFWGVCNAAVNSQDRL